MLFRCKNSDRITVDERVSRKFFWICTRRSSLSVEKESACTCQKSLQKPPDGQISVDRRSRPTFNLWAVEKLIVFVKFVPTSSA